MSTVSLLRTTDDFEKVSGYLVMLMETYESVTAGTLYTKSLEELQEQNHALYEGNGTEQKRRTEMFETPPG